MRSVAFAAVVHRLPSGAALRPLQDEAEAAALAAMLVAQEPWRALGYGAAPLARYLLRPDDPSLHRFTLLAGGAPAGVVCIRHPWLRGPYLELIGFAPAVQGRGLGGAVIGWMEAEVRGDAANLWAFVSEANTAARRFYAALGFRDVAAVPDLVAAGHAEMLVRKRLDGPGAQSGGGAQSRSGVR